MKFQTIKGTKDILPAESAKWQRIEQVVRDVFHRFGYSEIRTPVFEDTALFARGIGATTDIVSKEMFSFVIGADSNHTGDAEDAAQSLTLRPEMTAGVLRAYLQHTLSNVSPNTKLYYFGEMFRKEKPQAGRQRQFWQFGAECIGSVHPIADAELIAAMMLIYTELGITNTVLRLNSLGNLETRQAYRLALQEYLRPHFEKLDDVSKERFDKNPLRILDSKNPDLASLIDAAPRLVDFLDAESKTHFEKVQAYLKDFGIEFVLDFKLVRGLDYYSRTAFELTSSDLGAQDALGGGGRYDGLALELGSEKEVPAIGFACGVERLLMVMEKLGRFENLAPQKPAAFFIAFGDAAQRAVAKEVFRLRSKGIRCAMDLLGRGMKAQMKEADRTGATYAVIVGDDELQRGTAQLRTLAASTQTEISFSEIEQQIQVDK